MKGCDVLQPKHIAVGKVREDVVCRAVADDCVESERGLKTTCLRGSVRCKPRHRGVTELGVEYGHFLWTTVLIRRHVPGQYSSCIWSHIAPQPCHLYVWMTVNHIFDDSSPSPLYSATLAPQNSTLHFRHRRCLSFRHNGWYRCWRSERDLD